MEAEGWQRTGKAWYASSLDGVMSGKLMQGGCRGVGSIVGSAGPVLDQFTLLLVRFEHLTARPNSRAACNSICLVFDHIGSHPSCIHLTPRD